MTGIRTIGVIGAGQMGNGIAHVCALAGFDVVLNDVSADRLEAGIKTIQRNMERQVHRGMISVEQRDAGMRRIKPVTTLDAFADVEFAIEAATEKEAVKRAIFDEVCLKVPKTAMLATNTSSISITRLGAATDRRQRGQAVQRAGIEEVEAQLVGDLVGHRALARCGRAVDGNDGNVRVWHVSY